MRPGLEMHLGAVRQRLGPGLPEKCRVLLLGEDNPLSLEPHFALYHAPANCAGNRLQSLVLKLPSAQYLAIWRANLCTGGWDGKAARERALELVLGDQPWDVIVTLGVKVADAVRSAHGDPAAERYEPFTSRKLFRLFGLDRTVVAIPHPSGRNAGLWAKDNGYERARQLVRDAAPELWAAA